jgi:hypothetical protein
VQLGIKVEKFKQMAGDYWDKQLFDLLNFGFPLDVGMELSPSSQKINHTSATNYRNDIEKYIDKK